MITNGPGISINDQLQLLADGLWEPLRLVEECLAGWTDFFEEALEEQDFDRLGFSFPTVFSSDRAHFIKTSSRDIAIHLRSISFALSTLERSTAVFIEVLDGATCATLLKSPTEHERLSIAAPAIVTVASLVDKWKDGDVLLNGVVKEEVAEVEKVLRNSPIARTLLASAERAG